MCFLSTFLSPEFILVFASTMEGTLNKYCLQIRRILKTRAPLKVKDLPTLKGGGVKEQEALTLLSKK